VTAHFHLQPEQSELARLSKQFCQETREREDRLERAAFEGGAAIRNGDYSLVNLEPIVRWKSERAVQFLVGNSSQSIRRALEVAASSEASTREAVAALLALHGVDIKVASAILTAIFPDRYTVMDCSVLEALGYPRQDVHFYEDFLDFCNHVAASGAAGADETPLRNLDRALRQWSVNQSERAAEPVAV